MSLWSAVAKPISEAPSKIRSTPMAKPMNQTLEMGICASSMIPSPSETIPENTDQPQRGNFNIPAPMARNRPPTMKKEARTRVRRGCPSERIPDQQISREAPEQCAEQRQQKALPVVSAKGVHQTEDAAEQQHPSEDQNRGEGSAHVTDHAYRAEKNEQDSKGEKPSPGTANFLNSRCERVIQTAWLTFCFLLF